jgi:hypothetical protein
MHQLFSGSADDLSAGKIQRFVSRFTRQLWDCEFTEKMQDVAPVSIKTGQARRSPEGRDANVFERGTAAFKLVLDVLHCNSSRR